MRLKSLQLAKGQQDKAMVEPTGEGRHSGARQTIL